MHGRFESVPPESRGSPCRPSGSTSSAAPPYTVSGKRPHLALTSSLDSPGQVRNLTKPSQRRARCRVSARIPCEERYLYVVVAVVLVRPRNDVGPDSHKHRGSAVRVSNTDNRTLCREARTAAEGAQAKPDFAIGPCDCDSANSDHPGRATGLDPARVRS